MASETTNKIKAALLVPLILMNVVVCSVLVITTFPAFSNKVDSTRHLLEKIETLEGEVEIAKENADSFDKQREACFRMDNQCQDNLRDCKEWKDIATESMHNSRKGTWKKLPPEQTGFYNVRLVTSVEIRLCGKNKSGHAPESLCFEHPQNDYILIDIKDSWGFEWGDRLE